MFEGGVAKRNQIKLLGTVHRQTALMLDYVSIYLIMFSYYAITCI